jgi:uncharacterized protein (DUF2249 family)
MPDIIPADPDQRHAVIVAALKEIEKGTGLRAIAAAHDISLTTLHRWLLSEVPEQYRQLQQQGLIQRVADADAELDAAPDHVQVAKCAHAARFARWDAERRLPRLFGPRQEITGAGGEPLIPQDPRIVALRLAYLLSVGAAPVEAIDIMPEQDRIEGDGVAPEHGESEMGGGGEQDGTDL